MPLYRKFLLLKLPAKYLLMRKLLFLHGALGDKTQFKEILAELKEFDAEAIGFEGHGMENQGEEVAPFGMEEFARQVLQWMDSRGLEKTDIFGYSMGGYVALWLCVHYPERVGRVVTLATKFNWTPETAAKEVKMLNPEVIEQKVPAFAQKLANIHGAQNWKAVVRKTSGMMTELGRAAPLNKVSLEKVQSKVLIAVGDRDTMVSVEESYQMYGWVPEAQFLVLPASPHALEKVPLQSLIFHIRQFFG